MKTFGNKAGYSINIRKHVAFLYGNNELTEKEVRKKTPEDEKTSPVHGLAELML
jgi:hypothetical protein